MERPSILLVDDEVNVVQSLKRSLYKEPYKIHTATSAAEGFEILKEHPIQVVISDMRMPEMDGTTFLSQVREEFPDVIRIILSGQSDVEQVFGAINKGYIFKFLSKPEDEMVLKLTIRQGLDQHKLLREKADLMEQLKQSNETLEQRVKERIQDIQARDTILEHLLTVHNLKDSLDFTLSVLGKTFNIEKMAIYVSLAHDKTLCPTSAFGHTEPGKKSSEQELKILGGFMSHLEDPILKVNQTENPVLITSEEPMPPTAQKRLQSPAGLWLPICKDQECYGVFEVCQPSHPEFIKPSLISKLEGYTRLMAIAIGDQLVQSNLSQLENNIDDLLGSME